MMLWEFRKSHPKKCFAEWRMFRAKSNFSLGSKETSAPLFNYLGELE